MREAATVRLGVMLAVAMAILVAGIAWLRGPSGPTVVGALREGRGLRVGAPVLYRGLTVGTVTALAFTDSGIAVTLVLTRDDVPVRARDGLRVQTLGLLGDAAVELVPGPRDAAPYEEGQMLGEAPPDSAAARQRALLDSALTRLSTPRRDTAIADSLRRSVPPATSRP